jgi:oligopeptide/dipeptide ABC transporter ATP-binding protein
MSRPRLAVENVSKEFVVWRSLFGRRSRVVHAVDDVSFQVATGQTMALVGESGCGKTTLARTIAGLYVPTSGHIYLDGVDISVPSELRRRRRSVQLISQDPLSSLNRRRTIMDALLQPLRVHRLAGSRQEEMRIIRDLLDRVGLNDGYLPRYPAGMSVGELQRVTVARALALRPEVLILDEPTASIDLTMKGRLINLLLELQSSLGLTYLIITHEIDIAEHLSDWIAVMYLGRVVEVGPTDEVLARPRHPYTRSLLASVPRLDSARRTTVRPLAGEVPSSVERPTGCHFHPRCPIAIPECARYLPELRSLTTEHSAACHLAEPVVQFTETDLMTDAGANA